MPIPKDKKTGLTRKQKAFADQLINNPKISASEAVRRTYGKEDRPPTELAARAIASENLTKPNILAYMEQHVPQAQNTIIRLMRSDRDDIRLRAAQDILDRTTGKPGQATQQTNIESITINLGSTEPITRQYIEGEVNEEV